MKSPTLFVSTSLASLFVLCTACGSSGEGDSSGGAGGLGGTSAGGTAAGGAAASGGASTTGGTFATGGAITPTGGISGGGVTSTGGSPAGGDTAMGGGTSITGGTTSAGGANVTGGAGAGGATSVGGRTAVGGTGSGGRTGRGGGTATGGATGTTGGTTGAGGSADTGGTTGAGGSADTGGSTGIAGGTGVTVQLAQTKQTIQGFGINTALASGSIPVSTMFSTTGADGLGFSILRVGMNTDGSLTGSGISEAKAAGAKIIGSCWSAPANCKSNGKTTDGGSLNSSCYDSWSTTIANFASQQGLYAMSIANESDFASCPGNPVCTDSYDTMTYTAKQMVEFVKVAGPKLKAKGIKVIAPECSEWVHLWSNLSGTGSIVASHPDSSDPHGCGCFSNTITADAEAKCAAKCLNGDGYDYGHWLWKDQEAWKAFDIIGVHEYDSQIAYAWPADVNDGKRDREVWQTEMSGVMHWPEQGPSTDINNGVAVAGWIHSALTVGEASAWLYWWYQALYQDDNEGLAKLKSGGTTAKRYYTMGNYSKFVRPGYVAVDVTGNSDANVLLSAYKDPTGGTVVVVAINKGSAAAEVPITIAGGTAPTSCTPTVTSASDNLKDGTAVSVAAGVLTASLASKTVTTYVCK
jgi:glucuronoarabinoxylan endo-1,4-beta-xylanase